MVFKKMSRDRNEKHHVRESSAPSASFPFGVASIVSDEKRLQRGSEFFNWKCILMLEEFGGYKNVFKVNDPGWVLPSNSPGRLMGMYRWMGSHFHDWIDYNGVAFSIGANRVTRIESHICRISGVSKFRQVGIWGIFAQK